MTPSPAPPTPKSARTEIFPPRAGQRLSKTNNSTVVNYTLGSGNRLASWSASDTNSLVTDVRGRSSETIGTDDRWGTLWVSNVTAQAGAKPQVDGSGFVANNLPMQAGTNQYVAAIRDDAGNMGYATNVVVYSVVTNGTFGYDNAGCITNISHTGTGGYSDNLSLEWDEHYRLTSVSAAASVANYTYDVLGRRTSCSVGSASQTNTTYFIYDGNQVIADLDENGDVLRTYVWGTGIDNLLSYTDHTTTNTYYPIKDIQNTVIALVDETGSIVETYDYDAWGRTKIYSASGEKLSESSVGNRYLFQGREYDAVSKLYYFRARWYSPETGRWLSKDPLGISGGLNLYAFVSNNPVNLIDPSGLCEEEKKGSIGGKIWNLPNTIIGIGWGILGGGYIPWVGAEVSYGHNGIQFENHPFMPEGSGVTLGNAISYEGYATDWVPTYDGQSYVIIGDHEEYHTYQSESDGILFLPKYFLNGGISKDNPYEKEADDYARSRQ